MILCMILLNFFYMHILYSRYSIQLCNYMEYRPILSVFYCILLYLFLLYCILLLYFISSFFGMILFRAIEWFVLCIQLHELLHICLCTQTKGLRSKRRNSPYIFQVVACIPGRGPLCEKVLRKAIPWQPLGE
jgi:hypothetical protein